MNPKELYENLISRLKVFDAPSIISSILDVLLEIDLSKDLKPFWHCLTLLKWVISNCTTSKYILLRQANKSIAFNFLNDVAAIENCYHKELLEKENSSVFELLHGVANQQFEFQVPIDKFTFARQFIIYSKFQKNNSELSSQFLKISPLSIPQMLDAFFLLYITLYRHCCMNPR